MCCKFRHCNFLELQIAATDIETNLETDAYSDIHVDLQSHVKFI